MRKWRLERPLGSGSVLILLATTLVGNVSAQEPVREFSNLQVLPPDIQWPALQRIMRGFNSALGGQEGCLRCHVGVSGEPLATWDLASDEKRPKRIAREMLAMVGEINHRLSTLPGRNAAPVEVTCRTCHAGRTTPRQIQDELTVAYEAGGIDSLVTTYRTLRIRYYERDAYDFSAFPLRTVATQLRDAGELDDAIILQQLNVDTHPNDPREVRTLVALRLEREASDGGGAAAVALYWSLRRAQSFPFQAFDSALLDEVGDRIVGAGRVADAIVMLEVNAGLYRSWATHHALGEAHELLGDVTRAIEYYREALLLNPESRNTAQALDRLRGEFR